ncbi:PH domain-containing protein [Ammoniphilus sp. YIM 78166]|uniref:PH domain-containing protein n=1 Tax=Ammoniphilus sp. YIM 78166 TaxID=1644106 RepID=UPI0010701341|nr:PH domain-containing protein [Ammoniphilus sp. YIM 78166]
MFRKLASEALGLSDIGKVIDPKDYDKVDSDDYVMHEDKEKIYFLIKSKKDEYCFTNLALIHLDGDSAVSSKRVLKRYDWHTNQVTNVYLETAGTIDLDCEIKFQLGGTSFSIDVDKNQIEKLKDLYKTLIRISQIASSNHTKHENAHKSLSTAVDIIKGLTRTEADLSTQFSKINEITFNWLETKRNEYQVADYGYVFEKYINN